MPATRSNKGKAKKEEEEEKQTTPPPSPAKSTKSADATLRKKLKQLETFQQTPFPDFARPSAEECQAVCDALATMHPLPVRPEKMNPESLGANCGLGEPYLITVRSILYDCRGLTVPDVLDALVRTILSQNTTSKNSTAARKGIEEKFGKGPNYEAVRLGSQEELKEAIQCGGLANVKSKVIKKILDQVYEKEGKLSLDRLHKLGDKEAMTELVTFDGIGPWVKASLPLLNTHSTYTRSKTASCTLLFCMGRESFAVDSELPVSISVLMLIITCSSRLPTDKSSKLGSYEVNSRNDFSTSGRQSKSIHSSYSQQTNNHVQIPGPLKYP